MGVNFADVGAVVLGIGLVAALAAMVYLGWRVTHRRCTACMRFVHPHARLCPHCHSAL